jgi:hypothetical protein
MSQEPAELDEATLRRVVVDAVRDEVSTLREELSGLGLAARRGQWPRDEKIALAGGGGDRDDAEDKDGWRGCLSKQRQRRRVVMVLLGTVVVLALALAAAASPTAAGGEHPPALDAAVPAVGAPGSRR